MDKLKNKYEIILGFVTLIISLSAFKEELAKVSINTGYTVFTLADYFLYAVVGFSVCLYLYIIENILRDTSIGNWPIFDHVVRLAYFIFIFVLLTPILIVLNVAVFKVYMYVSARNIRIAADFFTITKVIVTIAIAIASELLARLIFNEKEKQKKEQIEVKQIKEIDNALKLFSDGYFSHSILESFKAIESFLYRKIIDKGIRVQPNRFSDLIKISVNEKIISEAELAAINDVRGMRNAAAHTDASYTKQQAEFALDVVKQLYQKDATT